MAVTKEDLDPASEAQGYLPNETKLGHQWTLLKTKLKGPQQEGSESVDELGHRRYVGGYWEQVGQLQFDFLKNQGLQPHHVLLDVACGSLRGGRFFIPYLDPGNYLAIEKEESLVEAGRRHEVADKVWAERKPEIVITDSFQFELLSRRPNFALAQSLFSHLESQDIERCLEKLYPLAAPGCQFFATFFECHVVRFYLRRSQSFTNFKYTRNQMRQFGERCGWEARYIGDWNHPRHQKMMLYTKP
jgi:hypothetical protein